MTKILLEIFGWYGMAAIVAAYFLNSFGIIGSQSFIYQFLNLTGALGIVVVSLKKSAFQPAILNLIWSVVALAALVKLLI